MLVLVEPAHRVMSVLCCPFYHCCCRLLQSIKDSVQHLDHAVTKELAFQEGMRHAMLISSSGSSSYSWLLSVATSAAVASAATAYMLMRRNAFS